LPDVIIRRLLGLADRQWIVEKMIGRPPADLEQSLGGELRQERARGLLIEQVAGRGESDRDWPD
jgi:hypothetical protein